MVAARSATAALWGRGAIDMKSQTAAEAVAAADARARGLAAAARRAEAHQRRRRGDRRRARRAVADRAAAGGRAGSTMLLNEGGGAVMPFGERRLYGVCLRREGHVQVQGSRARGRAGHASVPDAGGRRAAQACCPQLERIGSGKSRAYDVVDGAARLSRGDRGGPRPSPATAVERVRAVEPRLAALPRAHARGDLRSHADLPPREKINVIPARAEFVRRLPAAARPRRAPWPSARARELIGTADGLELEFMEADRRQPVPDRRRR